MASFRWQRSQKCYRKIYFFLPKLKSLTFWLCEKKFSDSVSKRLHVWLEAEQTRRYRPPPNKLHSWQTCNYELMISMKHLNSPKNNDRKHTINSKCPSVKVNVFIHFSFIGLYNRCCFSWWNLAFQHCIDKFNRNWKTLKWKIENVARFH